VWSARDAAVRIGAFPAFWAMVVAFVVPGDAWPTPVLEACDRLAQTLSPVALFAVGARLRLPEPGAAGPFWSGLAFKLVFAPLLALGWMRAIDPDAGPALRDVVALEAAMPPMVTGALLAQAAGLRAELAAAFLGVGVPVSLLTVPVWAALLRHVLG
jgi:predicted permease